MSKTKTVFTCQQCGYQAPKWLGKCPDCESWNSFLESIEDPSRKSMPPLSHSQKPVPATGYVEINESRQATGYPEFNRVMGKGITRGSLILIGGDPGIGKSTLLLQVGASLAKLKKKVLFVSAEESVSQVQSRVNRLKVEAELLLIMSETNMDVVVGTIASESPDFVIIDSIQTVFQPDLQSVPGSVSQVRECAMTFMRIAKKDQITIFLTGHVTKDGTLAGPKILEHLVDTVIQFEGDKNHEYRILRTLKNRYGNTHEIGIFEMTADGLTEITNPTIFLDPDHSAQNSGSVISMVLEGTRAIPVELQSLVSKSHFGYPQRNTNGFDAKRLTMLIAVLEKRLNIPLSQFDIYLNVAAGIRIEETGSDLAVCAAMISSFDDIAIGAQTAFIGEVGLNGECRPVRQLENRILELFRLGFTTIIGPHSAKVKPKIPDGARFLGIKNLQELIQVIK